MNNNLIHHHRGERTRNLNSVFFTQEPLENMNFRLSGKECECGIGTYLYQCKRKEYGQTWDCVGKGGDKYPIHSAINGHYIEN